TPATAQVLTWDPNGASAGTGGNGTWDTTSLFWTGTSGTVAWPSSGTAVFGGTSGTVTVLANGGPVNYWVGLAVNTMSFTTDGYVLSGTGRITMSNGGNLAVFNTIRVDGGATARLATNFYANGGIVKSGAGTLVISGQRTWRFGRDNYSGAANDSSFAGLTILESGSIFASGNGNNLGIGGTNGGSFIQTGGTISAGGQSLIIGGTAAFQTPASGFYGLYGGDLYVPSGNGGSNNLVDIPGVLYQRGGVFTQTAANLDYGIMVRGVVYATGGTNSLFSVSTSNGTRNWEIYSGGLIAVTGSAVWSAPSGVVMRSGGVLALNGAGDGVNGGRLTLGQTMVPASLTGTSSGVGTVSFDGGILRAAVSTTTFMQGLETAQINALGATIDSQGFDITIAQNLSAPTGSGLTSIALTGSGSGYIGAPRVQLSGGGGSGATAVAEFDYTTGQVTGITITSPGSGYTSAPTATLVGGTNFNLTTVATLGAVSIGTITPGGLTKTGTGTLTLTGTNTYGGGTLVSQGALVFGATNARPDSGTTTIAAGAVLGFRTGTAAGLFSEADVVAAFTSPSVSGSTGSYIAADTTTGALTVSSNLPSSSLGLAAIGPNPLTITGANSHSGGTWLRAGRLNVNSAAALGTGTFTIAAGTQFDNTSGSTLTLTTNNPQDWTGDFTFVGSNSLNMGTGTVTLSATAAGARQVTVSANTLTVGGVRSGTTTMGLTKVGPGRLVLTGSSTYTGTTTVNQGVLTVNIATGTLTSASPVTLRGGTFEVDNVGAVGARVQASGTLSTTFGDAVVRTTRTADQDVALSFAALAARQPWSTLNFVQGGGTNSAANGITLTGVATGFINQGMFFGGADYAYMNSTGGFVRAPVYGTDAGFAVASSSLVSGSNNLVSSSLTGVPTVSVTTIKFSGASGVDLTQNASTTLTLSSGGLLRAGGGSTTISGGTISAGSGVEYVFRTDTAADSLTVASVIGANGANNLSKSGAGTLTLSATNLYTGQTSLLGGTTVISSNANLGAQATGANLNIIDATLRVTADVGLFNGSAGTNNRAVGIQNVATFDVDASRTLTIAGVVSAGGQAVKIGAGTLTLSGSNTHSGGTLLNEGTLVVGNVDALGAPTAAVVVNSGTLNLNNRSLTARTGNFTLAGGALQSGTMTINSGTFDVRAGTIGSVLAGSGGLVKSTDDTVTLSATNTYTGGNTIASGRVVLGVLGAFGVTQNMLTLNSGTLDLNGFALNVLSLTGSAGGLITTSTASGTSTLGVTGTASSVYAGSIANNGAGIVALTKSGAGTLRLSGSNAHTGGNTVNAGTLLLDNAFGLGPVTNSLTMNSGTLNLNGNSVTVGSLSGSATGFVTTSATEGTTTLTVDTIASSTFAGLISNNTSGTMAVVKSGTGSLTLSGANTFTGGLTLTAGSLVLGNAGALGGAAAPVVVSSGTLNLGGSLSLTPRTGTVTFGGGVVQTGTLTVNSPGLFDGQAGTVSASLAGSAGLLKSSTGGLT
ncbi:MAG: autotransporter-associated beta strand repeat-containing protein, partial [Planctomycetota bacterium]